ncbi:hypothetical protein MHK_010437 [Candidatus Magnetomorum sp. HK-1]|nr:hypothetical protein MHK_010437 [Candidatus Magnetomorum sp. HK-1]
MGNGRISVFGKWPAFDVTELNMDYIRPFSKFGKWPAFDVTELRNQINKEENICLENGRLLMSRNTFPHPYISE